MGRLEPQGVGALVAALVAAGCGYAAVRAEPPAGVERIAVGTFRVHAGPPVLGAWIAEEVAREIASTPGVSLASRSTADATIEGEVHLRSDEAAALASTSEAPSAALADLRIRVTATLRSSEGTPLRPTSDIEAHAVREMSTPEETRALRATAHEAARQIVRALLRGHDLGS